MTTRTLRSTTATIALIAACWPGYLFAQSFEPIEFATLTAECQAVITDDGMLDPQALTTELIEISEDGTCAIMVESDVYLAALAAAEAEIAAESAAAEAVITAEATAEAEAEAAAAAEAAATAAAEAEAAVIAETEAAAAAEAALTAEAEAEAAMLAEEAAAAEAEAAVLAEEAAAAEAEAAAAMEAEAAAAAEAEAAAMEAEAAALAEADAAAEAEAGLVVEPEPDPAVEGTVVDESIEPEAEILVTDEAVEVPTTDEETVAEDGDLEAMPVEEMTPEETMEPDVGASEEIVFLDLSEECQAVILADGTLDPARLRPGQVIVAADGSCEVIAEGAVDGTEMETVDVREETAPPAAAELRDSAEESVDAVDVITETVTEETARSSDEEVEQAAAERQTATAEANADASGFSNNEIIRILGAAAVGVVIGTMLDNNDEVVDNSGDRIVVLRDGQYIVRTDENQLLRRPGSTVRTEAFADGSTRTIFEREDGVRIVTIRDANGYTVRRTRFLADGTEFVLFDDIDYADDEFNFTPLPEVSARADFQDYSAIDEAELLLALQRAEARELDGTYSLRQIRESEELRSHLPRVDLDVITFATGSAAISQSQAQSLSALGRVMARMIEDNPTEVFLIEGHTDAVGSEISNLALSDRRAESVALALTEYFAVPPENMVVQGYGEQFLKVQTLGDERANRRTAVRRITNLLQS